MNVSLRSFSIYFKKVSLREDSHRQEYNAVKNSVYVCVEVGGWTLGGCLVVYNTTHFWFQVCLSCPILLGSTVCQLRKKPKTWWGAAEIISSKLLRRWQAMFALVFLITAVLLPNKRKINTLKLSGRLSRHHLEWSTKENVLADYTAS